MNKMNSLYAKHFKQHFIMSVNFTFKMSPSLTRGLNIVGMIIPNQLD